MTVENDAGITKALMGEAFQRWREGQMHGLESAAPPPDIGALTWLQRDAFMGGLLAGYRMAAADHQGVNDEHAT